jgi:hypothetical protein
MRGLIPLESVASYQFAVGGATAGGAGLQELRDAVARCDVQIAITGGRLARDYTQRRLRDGHARPVAGSRSMARRLPSTPEPFIEDCAGWPAAQDWLAGYLAGRDLAGLEEQMTRAHVSNPWAGDVVLGHLIVMAELGLGTLTARAPRDPGIFEGAWSRPRRAGHILAWMGFTRALWSLARGEVTLYRGMAIQARPETADSPGRRNSPLISASFSRQIAESHFGARALPLPPCTGSGSCRSGCS